MFLKRAKTNISSTDLCQSVYLYHLSDVIVITSPRWLHTDCTQAPRPMPVAQCTHMSKTWAWFAFIHGTSITGSSDAVNVLAPFLWWDFIVTSPYCQTHACKGLLHLCTLHRISWKRTSCSLPFLYDYQHTCQFIQEGHGVDQPPIQ